MAKMTEAERRQRAAERKAAKQASVWDKPLSAFELEYAKKKLAEDRAAMAELERAAAFFRLREIRAVDVLRRRKMEWSDIEEATGISRIALHRRLTEFRKNPTEQPKEPSLEASKLVRDKLRRA